MMLKGTKSRTLEAVIMEALALAWRRRRVWLWLWLTSAGATSGHGQVEGGGPSILIPLSAISRNAPGASSRLWQERREHRAKKGQKDESHR
ncbi:hypothetical protein IWZ01DRAFT_509846 [Phyllosticta capitalensis]